MLAPVRKKSRRFKRLLLGAMLVLFGSIAALTVGVNSAAPGGMLYPLEQQLNKLWASRATSPAARSSAHLGLAVQHINDLEAAMVSAPQSGESILVEWELSIREAT